MRVLHARGTVAALAATLCATVVLPQVARAAPAGADRIADGWTARPARYDVAVDDDVPITMSDGTVLYAQIHRPAIAPGRPAPGRFPVLMAVSPYNKNVMAAADDYLVRRGYVDVVVDVRGTGSSEGVYTGSYTTREQLDGKELVEWAAAQPWSTGAVGLHGQSYFAINQLLTAAQQPKGLKAIFPVVASGDNYRSTSPGGYVTSLSAFPVAVYPGFGAIPPGYTGTNPLEAFRVLATRPAAAALNAAHSTGMLLGDDTRFDGPRTRSISPLWLIDRIKVPTFLAGGWLDALSQRDAPLMFRELQRRGVPTKLLMGAWYHTTAGSGLPADGVPDLHDLMLRWFDHFVADRPDPGLSSWGPVVYADLGTAHYRSAPSWPPPGVSYRQLRLGPGSLSAAPAASGWDTLVWQPASGPCSGSTYVGLFGIPPSTPCQTDNRINDATGLSYDLPVERPMTLAGPMSARLFVRPSASDAHLALHVEDVDPSGAARELTAGWDTLSFRALDRSRSDIVDGLVVRPFHPYTKASVEEIRAGRTYEWWIEIRPTAARIAGGHRLRLSVQTSDTVRFLPTATNVATMAGSTITILRDRAHPSALIVPIARP